VGPTYISLLDLHYPFNKIKGWDAWRFLFSSLHLRPEQWKMLRHW